MTIKKIVFFYYHYQVIDKFVHVLSNNTPTRKFITELSIVLSAAVNHDYGDSQEWIEIIYQTQPTDMTWSKFMIPERSA